MAEIQPITTRAAASSLALTANWVRSVIISKGLIFVYKLTTKIVGQLGNCIYDTAFPSEVGFRTILSIWRIHGFCSWYILLQLAGSCALLIPTSMGNLVGRFSQRRGLKYVDGLERATLGRRHETDEYHEEGGRCGYPAR